MLLRALAFLVPVTCAAAHRAAAQDLAAHRAIAPGRVLLEGALGAARSRLPCRYCDGRAGPTRYERGQLTAHWAAGYAPSPAVALMYAADAGERVTFEATTPYYRYRTLVAEVAAPSLPWIAARVGAGRGRGTDYESARFGRGTVVRGGIVLRSSPTRDAMLVVSTDVFRGVSGRFFASTDGRVPSTPYRPITLQLTGTLRLQSRL